jgi:hypothetical protein
MDHFGTNGGMVFGAALANADSLAQARNNILEANAEIRRLSQLIGQRDAIIDGLDANIAALKAELPKSHPLLQMTGTFTDGTPKSTLGVKHFTPVFLKVATEKGIPKNLIDSVI